MTLSLSAKTTAGRNVLLPPPIELSYSEDRFVPCPSLSFTVPLPEGDEGCEYSGAAAALNGKPLFDGLIDRQTVDKSAGGKLLRMECRNRTALLLDNEVKPYYYFQLTSSQLFERHAAPNGVLGAKFPYEAKRNYLQVKKGSSHWNVIEQFCRLTYRRQPYVNRNRVLVLEPLNEREHLLSNRQAGGVRYTRAALRWKNDKLLSRIYMKTATETYGYYYGFSFDNPEAARRGVKRERYYHPQNTVTENAKEETLRLLNNSTRDSFEAEITLPGLLDAETGDRVRLPDELISLPLYIRGLCFELSPTGVTTTLTLTA